jgi:thioredoxin reductase (NADPH)
MKAQALRFGAEIRSGSVESLSRQGDILATVVAGIPIPARTIIMTSGVANKRPSFPDELHNAAVQLGLLRYCPICDGFEVTDKKVAVLGSGGHACKEAAFLRSYTRDVTLILDDPDSASSEDAELQQLREAGVIVASGPVGSITIDDQRIGIDLPGGKLCFESAYIAMGSDIRSHLAAGLGADLSEEGCIVVDSHQRTTVLGLYAAGDVVIGLDQISRAVGTAATAATAVRNDLAALHGLRR